MQHTAEERISTFYNGVGWETNEGVTEDAKRWEDLRAHARSYVGKCRMRVNRHIPEGGTHFLDMASGPIQYPEYLTYSRHYEKRHCVDLSSGALEQARRRIGDHGVFHHGSFFDLPMEDHFFDCTVSLHTLYHIDKDRQEEAVRKLLRVTKAGKPVIIVYSNPNAFVTSAISTLRALSPSRLVRRASRKARDRVEQEKNRRLYFYAHPLDWWDRFADAADIEILPWRSFGANVQRRLIPNNTLGAKMFDALFALEERFPAFFVRHFEYPMIVLTPRPDTRPGVE